MSQSSTLFVSQPLSVPLVPQCAPISSDTVSSTDRDQELVGAMFGRRPVSLANLDWTVALWMLALHAGCMAAPWFFSWSGLLLAAVLHWLTCSIGVCLAYHRCTSHKSLRLVGPARFFALLCGVLSGEGTPLMWSATHRVHHAKSDKPGDPHSPVEGVWWSHLMWLFVRHDHSQREALYRRYAPDLARDRLLVFFEKTYILWLLGMAAALYALGGWSWLLWGVCVRLVVGYHTTWLINSATHLWGYRNYETTDDSRNLWWVALLAYGEGWHNNHHAHPRIAKYGHRWWELDLTWLSIVVLRTLGLATDVDDRMPEVSSSTSAASSAAGTNM